MIKLNDQHLRSRARNAATLAAARGRPRPAHPAGRAGSPAPHAASGPNSVWGYPPCPPGSRGGLRAPGPPAPSPVRAPTPARRPARPPRPEPARPAPRALPPELRPLPAPLARDWPGRSAAAADWCSPRASFACGGAGRAAEPRRGSCAGAAARAPVPASSRRSLRALRAPGPSGTWLSAAASRRDGHSRARGDGYCPLRCRSSRAARGSLGICPSFTFRACPAAWLRPSFLWLGYTARL